MCFCLRSRGVKRAAPLPTRSAASRVSAASCALPGGARPDWWIVSEVAKRMGHGDAFSYTEPDEIFSEHAALSAFENDGVPAISTSGPGPNLDPDAYEDLAPFQWPRPAGIRRRRTHVRRRPLLSRRTARPASFPVQLAERGAGDARFRADAQHRPRPRSLAHDDTHGQKPAPLPALRRAVRRNSSRRCRALSHLRRRSRARLDGARRLDPGARAR